MYQLLYDSHSIDKGNFFKKQNAFFFRIFSINVISALFRIDLWQKLFQLNKNVCLRLFKIWQINQGVLCLN